MSSENLARWWQEAAVAPDATHMQQATERQQQLTKPAGSLGRLEDLAIRLAGLQGRPDPAVDRVWISIFAGDHGIAGEAVSAFPQSVTGEMLRNFAAGGAAICVLARSLGATLRVLDLGLVEPVEPLPGVEHLRLAPGTANMCIEPAMTTEQCALALRAGRDALSAARTEGAELFIAGDMGIGNTSSACALASALLELPPSALVGPGTGLDGAGVAHKLSRIDAALDFHAKQLISPLQILQRLGGLEIAAMAGAYVAAAQQGVAVLVDGYISSVAALCAVRLNPSCRPWLLFSHHSAEPGHTLILQALEASPLLNLGMRLGEGSGAAVAVPLLRAACALHNQMATFAEASVSVSHG